MCGVFLQCFSALHAVSHLYPELADLANLESQLTLENPIFASDHLGECRLPDPFHIYVGAGNPNPSPHVVWPVLYPTDCVYPALRVYMISGLGTLKASTSLPGKHPNSIPECFDVTDAKVKKLTGQLLAKGASFSTQCSTEMCWKQFQNVLPLCISLCAVAINLCLQTVLLHIVFLGQNRQEGSCALSPGAHQGHHCSGDFLTSFLFHLLLLVLQGAMCTVGWRGGAFIATCLAT